MKHLLPSIFFAAIALSASAQNYQLLKSNNQYLYHMAVGHAGLEVKQVEFDGDSIFWLAPHWIRLPDEWGCAFADSSSMLGRKVRIAADGTTVLYTAYDETITLLTQRNPGDAPWIAYTAADGTFYIEAEVSARVAENILGVADSVKTFSFQSYNSDGIANNPWISNLEIRIAKNTGLVHSPQWGAFPGYSGYPTVDGHFDLSGIEGQAGMQNIKQFDVYDFEIDDEIHIEQKTSNFGEGVVNQMIRRYLSRQDYADSVVYEVEVKRWTYQGSMMNINLVYQGTTIESQTIRSNHDFDALPASPVVYEYDPGSGYYTGTYFKIGLYEGFPAKYLPAGGDMFTEYPESDGCFLEIIDWGCFSGGHTYYVKGLGGPYSECSFGAPSFSHTKLMYFNKSGVEWGSPLSTTASERLSANALTAYPNPASESFRLGLMKESYPLQVELYDVSGRLLGSFTLNNADDLVRINGLPSGMLLIHARQRDGHTLFGKLMVK